MRSLYVDVLGRPEREFWRSTFREISQRWIAYAACMGYIKPVEEVQVFDDE